MAKIERGSTAVLEYTKQARFRIGVGISWDAIEEDVERPELYILKKPVGEEGKDEDAPQFTNPYGEDIDPEIGVVKDTFDLDLVCLMFNKENEIVDAVSPMDGEEVDLSGKIYHSGDERHGVSINDDEMISVELKDLPEYIHHIVFFSTIQSGHDFATVVNPEARVFDGMSNKNLLLEKIDGEDLAGKTAHIFCRIYRGEEDWMIHNISELRVDAEIKDWVKEVKPFLK